jgi:hypothetical protein
MFARLTRPHPLLSLLGVMVVAILILLSFGRPPICECGTIDLWGRVGPEQSQMLADWYTPSHIVHGFLFYALLHLAARRWPVERRFLVALIVEAVWEILENTPMIIDRYREATIALGYSGDSILNSVSDILLMALGFWAARRFPIWVSVAVVLLLELIPLLAIRDNLTLNVLMLVAPSDAVRTWQAGA